MNQSSLLNRANLFEAGLFSWGIPQEVARELTEHHNEVNYGSGKLIFSQGLFIIAIGLTLGIATALGTARLIGDFLTISPIDPLTYLGVSALLLTVALAACYVPARRAMRVDPMVALRYE